MKTTPSYLLCIACLLLCSISISFAQTDSDGDGISDDVDLNPNVTSINFQKMNNVQGWIDSTPPAPTPIPGLTIIDDPDPLNPGVLVDATGAYSGDIIIYYYCGSSLIDKVTFVGGNGTAQIFCASSNITALSGTLIAEFSGADGSIATVEIPSGNTLKFESETVTFIAPPTNTNILSVEITGGTVTSVNIPPGSMESINPYITEINLPDTPVKITTQVSVSATLSETYSGSGQTAIWDWGDGSTTEIIIPNNSGNPNIITEDHTYTIPGVYAVSLTVTDEEGNISTVSSTEDNDETTSYILVYDPLGGFVTGGGWIESPEGAYVSAPQLSGKASFGFVSKYQKGKSIPSGQTDFQFNSGGLNFHSSDYDWLVINQHKAMYKGSGTINQTGNYGFQLSAIDADLTPSTDVDLFRIRIWDKDNDDALVYDNLIGEDPNRDPTSAIGGGSIKIQNNKNNANSLSQATLSPNLLERSAPLRVFPNPFNGKLEIQFKIEKNSLCRLSVFDLFGREIRLLSEKKMLAGWHEEIWDGRGNSGQPLPGGIYFIQLQMNDQSFYQQVILME